MTQVPEQATATLAVGALMAITALAAALIALSGVALTAWIARRNANDQRKHDLAVEAMRISASADAVRSEKLSALYSDLLAQVDILLLWPLMWPEENIVRAVVIPKFTPLVHASQSIRLLGPDDTAKAGMALVEALMAYVAATARGEVGVNVKKERDAFLALAQRDLGTLDGDLALPASTPV